MIGDLPAADVSCGACGTTLYREDGLLVCDECGLTYDPEDLQAPAAFHDRNAAPCGDTDHPQAWSSRRPFLTVSEVVKTWRTWHYRYEPCALPAGHTSDHHYPKITTFTDEEATGA